MTLDDLIAYGANVQDAMARCMNNEAFYLRLVESVRPDDEFIKLRNAVEAKNFDEAFEVAHSLKGVLGNLALDPITEPVVEITELLRTKSDVDYSELLDRIDEQHERFKAL